MTRGGLSIDQKQVTLFVRSVVSNPQILKDGFSLKGLTGDDEKVGFGDSLEYLSRGLCLELQRRERDTTSVKMTDLKGALNSPNPLEFLKAKGYDQKVLAKVFKS